MTLTNEQKDKIREDYSKLIGKELITNQNPKSDGNIADWWLNIIEEQLERQRLEIIGGIEALRPLKLQYATNQYLEDIAVVKDQHTDDILALPSLNPKNE